MMTTEDRSVNARIETQVRDLTAKELDRYYFEVLKRTMECSYDTYVAGYRVWDHEVIWRKRNAPRLGYLIFGSPTREMTALPPRDFSLYIIPPFTAPPLKESQQSEELWLRLEKADAWFRDTLKRYVAALEIAAEQTDEAELDYENRAAEYLDQLYHWIDTHAADAFSLTFENETATLGQWCDRFGIPARGCLPTEDGSCLRDLLNEVTGSCLSDHFSRQAPDYPRFPFFIPGSDRGRLAREALRHMAGAPATPGSRTVLKALRLMEDGVVDPLASPYAVGILEALDADPSRPLLRRAELIPETAGHRYLAPERIRLEPEWVLVLLAGLLQAGDIALIIQGARYTAERLQDLAVLPMADLLDFEAVERLPGWNRQVLHALCTHLGLSRKRALELARGGNHPIQRLFRAAADLERRMAAARERVAEGMPFWGAPLLTTEEVRKRRGALQAAADWLEALQGYPDPDALREFLRDPASLDPVSLGRAALTELAELDDRIHRLCDLTGYLTAAEALLPTRHPWSLAALEARDILRREMRDPRQRGLPTFVETVRRALGQRRDTFIDLYITAHDAAEGASGRLVCRDLHREELRHSPLCPHCRFKPWESRSGEDAGSGPSG